MWRHQPEGGHRGNPQTDTLPMNYLHVDLVQVITLTSKVITPGIIIHGEQVTQRGRLLTPLEKRCTNGDVSYVTGVVEPEA